MADIRTGSEMWAVLVKLRYDATGLATCKMVGEPVVAWAYDNSNPQNGATPITPSPAAPAPPVTNPVITPKYALTYPWQSIVYVSDEKFAGSSDEFFTWLATNNGANRKLSGQFAASPLRNDWVTWAAKYPSQVF